MFTHSKCALWIIFCLAVIARPAAAAAKIDPHLFELADQKKGVMVIVQFKLPEAAFGWGAKQVTLTDVITSARRDNEGRIIDTFRVENGPGLTDEIVLKQRSEIARIAKIIRATLPPKAVRYIFEFTPTIVATVHRAELETLARSDLISEIVEDRPLDISLEQSVPLIGGGPAGLISGYSGSGQYVAVIDFSFNPYHQEIEEQYVKSGCFTTNDTRVNSNGVAVGGYFASCLTKTNDSSSSTYLSTESYDLVSPTGHYCCGVIALGGTNTADEKFHGSASAGIVGAKGVQLYGVAPKSKLILAAVGTQVYKDYTVCGGGNDYCVRAQTADVIRALSWVYSLRGSYPIAAVNISLGSGSFTASCDSYSTAANQVISMLRNANIATIASTGNEGTKTGIHWPACVSTAIAVGSTDKTDHVLVASNSSAKLGLLAPGSSIHVPWVSTNYDTNYARLTGTSAAAPHVAGAFAILAQARPGETVSRRLQRLQDNGVPLLDPGNSLISSRIQVDAAISDNGVFYPVSAQLHTSEAVGFVDVPVNRHGGYSGIAMSIDCVPVSGTASAGNDFNASAVRLTWAASEGGSTKNCRVPVIRDSVQEGSETFAVRLNSVNGSRVGLPIQTSVVVDADNSSGPSLPVTAAVIASIQILLLN